MSKQLGNESIAALLERIGALLEPQEANAFRVRAYRAAASTIRNADVDVAALAADEDRAALMNLPGIGDSLAGLISDYVKTGRSELLDQLESQATPEAVFGQVPGIGETLARRISDELGINTLEELEMAAHSGRLNEVPGFGADRVRGVRAALAGMLGESAQRRARQRSESAANEEPSLADLLDVDAEYRRKAAAGELPTIAPKRFNPEGEAWLPVLHTRRGPWSYTALFSNTARAHEAGKTRDWVVIYFEREGKREEQRTVVTETAGPFTGKRVVRGREMETRRFYEQQ